MALRLTVMENVAEITSVLGVIYKTPPDCPALDFTQTMTDVTPEQQIQTRHPWEFP